MKKLFVLYLILVVAAVVIFSVFGQSTTNKGVVSDSQPRELVGKVNFSGGQFHITNQESENWKSCWFQVNGKYKYPTDPSQTRLGVVRAGQTVSIGAGEFTLKDGTRLNPFSIKANDFSASCEQNRFGYWTW